MAGRRPGSSGAGEPGPERRHACCGLKPNVRPQLRPTSLAASQLPVAAGGEALSSDRFPPSSGQTPRHCFGDASVVPRSSPAGDRIGTLAIAGRRDLLRRSDVPAGARVGDPPLRGGCCANLRRAHWSLSKGGVEEAASRCSSATRPAQRRRCQPPQRPSQRVQRRFSPSALCNSHRGKQAPQRSQRDA